MKPDSTSASEGSMIAPGSVFKGNDVRRSWTDMEALCEALRLTRSKGEAAALIATWRAPKRAKQLPLALPAETAYPANDVPPSREAQVDGARGVLRAIDAAAHKAVAR